MGSFSFWHWLIVLLVILIIFGAGKLPKVAGDLASGIKNFRKGMKEDVDEKPAGQPPVINQQSQPTGGAANTGAPADKSAQN
ncbi:twin-arginine translocase TatA/TatE family subunit [uncultured Ferrovibrio sp.]|jgi:sec-independent protein translocase protein TatA|uniref:twin-arginine translocase TatA/TatE family subunit n=1 Tax=uncultured Ferrovibrio sp. TaxID=1576913 RepID=UPI00261A3815|nr:twin-arginine translocase TatA/TatE family subunit [uncultured Ferrovibrio sp.]